MKHELKFRVWDNVDCMSQPFTLQDLQNKLIQFTWYCPVMQYTGLKDRNGREIYEGDIVSYDIDRAKWVIEYKANAFYGKYVESNLNVYQQDLENKNYLQFDVIGNIYENPELIK